MFKKNFFGEIVLNLMPQATTKWHYCSTQYSISNRWTRAQGKKILLKGKRILIICQKWKRREGGGKKQPAQELHITFIIFF
jgi:hypothetical protein